MAGAQFQTRYLPLDVTIPAGTTMAAPLRTPLALDGWVHVDSFELTVPPGPVGSVGVAFVFNGKFVVPFGDGTVWIVEDDYRQTFDVQADMDTQAEVWAYNLGVFPHTVRFRFKVVTIGPAAPTSFTLPDLTGLSSAAPEVSP